MLAVLFHRAPSSGVGPLKAILRLRNRVAGLAESGLCAGVAITTVAPNIKPGKEAIYRISWDT
jgi:hypothetical protein